MKNIALLSLLVVFVNFTIIAQPIVEHGFSGTTSSIRFYNMDANTYNVLEGNPYIPATDFQDGAVLPAWTKENKWFTGYKLRLNTYTKQLEMVEFGKLKTVSPDAVKGFKIGTATYLSGYPAVDKLSKDAYYQVLYDGKVKLLKNTTTFLKEVRAADDVKQGDKFVTDVYYYIFENETMTKFFPNKKNFLKAVSIEKLTKVEDFVNSKNLKCKEENDFIEVIKFYDSL